ncbi:MULTISPECIES: zinc-binding dehydrogenase [unclassified Streptomyces]|uniref:zinc-binding dehydrogenase n=1 Tax=unclassified Streptomyces TaxID=2593676 RepID=UPI003369C97A
MGLCAVIGARLLGAGLVVATATRPEHAKLSERFGADVVINPRRCDAVEEIRALVGAADTDCAIDAVGTHEAFENALRVAREGGKVADVGYQDWCSQGPLPIPVGFSGPDRSGKTIRSALAPGGSERLARLLRLMQTGRVDPTAMTTHRFHFDEATRAFELLQTEGEHIVKPLIT